MKIVIARETIQAGVSRVQNLVAAKSALPILSNILLRANGGALTLVATDLEVGIECAVPCTVERQGATTVPARRLVDVIGTLPAGDVTLEVDEGHKMALSSGAVQFHLLGQSAEEFPRSPTFSDEQTIAFEQPALKNVLKKTSFAISTDLNRLALTGMLFDLREREVRFVATDGRRLSFARLDADTNGLGGSYIVPRKTVTELERLIGDEEPIHLFLGESQIAFRFANVVLISRVIDGHFPNYEQVIPKNHELSATMRTEDLHQATRRAAVMTSDKNNVIRLELHKGKMTVATMTPDVGDVRDEIDIQYAGNDLQIGFNPHFLLDILKVAAGEELSFYFKDPLSPGLLKFVGNEDLLYVVMPIKL